MDYAYAYLVGNLILFAPWLLLYMLLGKVRREMIVVGLLLGFLSLLTSAVFASEYWTPEFLLGRWLPIEDFLYGFLIGGIGSGGLHVIARVRGHHKITRHRLVHTLVELVCIVAVFFALLSIQVPAIYAAIGLLLVTALAIYFKRHDLIVYSFFCGVLLCFVTLLGFVVLLLFYPDLIDRWWNLEALSGIRIASVPGEEVLWSFCLGLVVGPLYEYASGDKIKPRYNITRLYNPKTT